MNYNDNSIGKSPAGGSSFYTFVAPPGFPPLPGMNDNPAVKTEGEETNSTPENHTQTKHSSSFTSSSCESSESVITCKCIKTKCLKLYCECFHAGNLCNSDCSCQNCGNIEENRLERLSKMAEILKRNSNAFDEDQNSFVKKRRKEKPGCACATSKCLKKYCSCYFNQVACTGSCNCSNCSNPFGQMEPASNDMLLNHSPACKSTGRNSIEHYDPANLKTTQEFELHQEANYHAATANLLSVKQMLLQSRHKLFDLEQAHEALQDSGADKMRLERHMGNIREVVSDISQLQNEVKKMKADIEGKYLNEAQV